MANVLLSVSNVKSLLLTNNQILEAFPFLQPLKTKAAALGSCAPCQRGKKGQELDAHIQDAVKRIVDMDAASKASLKTMLNASTVRAYYRDNVNGRMVRKRVEW